MNCDPNSAEWLSMRDSFSHVTDWIFDLDNTLYPRHCDLFAQIDVRMTDFVSRLLETDPVSARKVQKDLYREFGTTLHGLMHHHDVDPHEFLAHVHDIDYSQLPANPGLGELIRKLPGRKHVYTNGSTSHAENTLAALGIDLEFDTMFDIVASDFIPKPAVESFNKFITHSEIEPGKSAMFEDIARNLEPAKKRDIATVLIVPQAHSRSFGEHWEIADPNDPHVDHITDDLDGFLTELLAALEAK